LLPETLFAPPRAEIWLWLFAALSIAALIAGADRAVSAAARLAKSLGMSAVLVGATVVSLGTTTPEAVVSLQAAMRGNPALALGNSVGSIICNMALIFGLACLLTRLPLNRSVLKGQSWIQLGAGALLTGIVAVLLWLAGWDMGNIHIPRIVGVAFLVLLVGYLYASVRWTKRNPVLIPKQAAIKVPANHRVYQVPILLGALAIGLALIIGGSDLLIGSVSEIARRHHMPQAVLAVTVVSLGTSLPELATAIAAILKGQPDLLVGNVIGANILNVLFVIGIAITAAPDKLQVQPIFCQFLLPVMLVVLMCMTLYVSISGKRFRRWQGAPLLAIYIAFIIILVTVFGTQSNG